MGHWMLFVVVLFLFLVEDIVHYLREFLLYVNPWKKFLSGLKNRQVCISRYLAHFYLLGTVKCLNVCVSSWVLHQETQRAILKAVLALCWVLILTLTSHYFVKVPTPIHIQISFITCFMFCSVWYNYTINSPSHPKKDLCKLPKSLLGWDGKETHIFIYKLNQRVVFLCQIALTA